MTIDERVAKGADLLERRYGPNWRAQVNPHTLRMDSGCRCVLGQLYGGDDVDLDYETGYQRALRKLRLKVAWAYGFTLGPDENESAREAGDDDPYWKALAKAWRKELKRTA